MTSRWSLMKLIAVTSAFGLGVGLRSSVAFAASESASTGKAPKTISFDIALQAIVDSNTALGTERARLDASQARLLSSQSAFLPTLSLSASQERDFQRGSAPTFDTHTYGATASLNLFRFGADISGWRAALWAVDEQRQRLRSAELEAEGVAVRALIDWIELRRQTTALEESLTYSRQYHAIAKARFARGVLPAEEVDKVAIDLANSEAGLQDTQSQLNSSTAGLRALIHERHDVDTDRLAADWPWKDKFHSRSLRTWVETPSNPDLSPSFVAARARLAADENRTRRQKRLILPRLDASYSWQSVKPDSGDRIHVREGLLVLSLPLFEGLTDYASYREQRANEIAARLAFEESRRLVPSTQEAARKNFVIAYQTAIARERTLSTSRALLKSALNRFRVGRTRADDLLLDQSRVLQAELLAIKGWAAAHRAALDLLHAYGQSVRTL